MHYRVQIYSSQHNHWFNCKDAFRNTMIVNINDAIKFWRSKTFKNPKYLYRVIDSHGTVIKYNKIIDNEKIEWNREGF